MAEALDSPRTHVVGRAPNEKSEHAMAAALALHEHSYGCKSEWLTTLASASSGPLFLPTAFGPR